MEGPRGMIQGVNINEMISQSIAVLTKPAIGTFEQFEKRGGSKEAFTYVGLAAVIVGVVGFIFGLLSGFGSAIAGLLGAVVPVVSFLVFAYVVYAFGKSQGGSGTQDEVFYSLSLFTAPLLAITGVVAAIPFINCLLLPVQFVLGLYQLYLGYLGTRSSMNLDQSKGIITVLVAIVAQFVVAMIIGGIITAVALGGAVASGAFSG